MGFPKRYALLYLFYNSNRVDPICIHRHHNFHHTSLVSSCLCSHFYFYRVAFTSPSFCACHNKLHYEGTYIYTTSFTLQTRFGYDYGIFFISLLYMPVSLISLHLSRTLGYVCPRCSCKLCEVPSDCAVCGISLVRSRHLLTLQLTHFFLTIFMSLQLFHRICFPFIPLIFLPMPCLLTCLSLPSHSRLHLHILLAHTTICSPCLHSKYSKPLL